MPAVASGVWLTTCCDVVLLFAGLLRFVVSCNVRRSGCRPIACATSGHWNVRLYARSSSWLPTENICFRRELVYSRWVRICFRSTNLLPLSECVSAWAFTSARGICFLRMHPSFRF
ncbi:hypothetical protein CALCODRAFT_203560 [Calocera cornea HHB12733]|uniref:Uncharacterized protein n=1 Tax=Calocera cornea HHB12733 TaxID=1353952 RepID=A0A165JYT9_9BASI|nr:hypothetical protein CALCODRAFT_203560 [Calocera cornea HHB12733]